ncbi:hypothetical protein LguiB_003612 [Lonicera macranthoides]
MFVRYAKEEFCSRRKEEGDAVFDGAKRNLLHHSWLNLDDESSPGYTENPQHHPSGKTDESGKPPGYSSSLTCDADCSLASNTDGDLSFLTQALHLRSV